MGQTIEPELVVSWLTDQGFERTDSVDMPGSLHIGEGLSIFFAGDLTAG